MARLSSILEKNKSSIGCNGLSTADFLVSSALVNSNVNISQANVKKWLQTCSKLNGASNAAPSKSQSPEVTPVASSSGAKDKCLSYLKSNGISYENVDHPEVFTVEAMMPYLKNIDGAITKNLFLKDKGKKLYLLSTLHNRKIDLKDIAKKAGTKDMRFGDEKVSRKKLHEFYVEILLIFPLGYA